MKKIHVLIIKAFIRPFLVTFFIVMFVLLMLFLFKYVDDLIGKGFEWYVILELLGYQALVQISMAMPLSMLLSAIMTFGNLGESYELVAIKAAGISIRKAMMPLLVLVSMFGAGAFLFSDYILPIANLKMSSLLYDIRMKPADFLIKPGLFNNTIPGYSIRARDKSKDGKILKDLLIYDHQSSNTANIVIVAKEGYVHNSMDNNYMIIKLIDGVRYEESRNPKTNTYDPRQQFTRFHFDETEMKFNMEAFQLKRTDQDLFKSHHSMLNLKQLKHYRDSTTRQLDSLRGTLATDIKPYIFFFSNYYRPVDSTKLVAVPNFEGDYLKMIPQTRKSDAIFSAHSQATYIANTINSKIAEQQIYEAKNIRYDIEWQRKFTLAVSCLLLFGIGAPLGAIIRKGGLGLPVVMAIIFFLIYYILSTTSEKWALEGDWDVVIGMWFSIIVLTPLAVFLTYKSATDSALFDLEVYRIKYEKIKIQLNDWWKSSRLNIFKS